MSRSECEAIRPLISAALDGELDEGEFVRLSEHLASCSHCRRIHHDYYRLRDGIRSVDAPAPPPDLTRTIRQETVEKPPPSTVVRFISRAGLRFGMSTAAASIVLIIIIAVFGFHTHQQMTHPAIASSEPVPGSEQIWPINRPIKIHFSKQMDQDSVLDNLTILPSSEQDRLPTRWDGNTLIIGRSEVRSVLLQPETDYFISIRQHALDVHGNPIAEFWTLSFRTGPADVAVSTPTTERDLQLDASETEEPTADSDPSTEQPATEAPSPEGQASATPSGGSGSGSAGDEDSRRDEDSDEPSGSGPSGSGSADDGDSSDPTPMSTAEPTQTPEPDPTATPRPDPTPSPSPEPTATPTPTPPPSPDPIPVRGAFGEVYWGNESIQQSLGKPTQPEIVRMASAQEFQRGLMFRFVEVAGVPLYVFVNGGNVLNYNDSWTEDDGEFPGEAPSRDLHVPQEHFGKVWFEYQSAVADPIGYALTPEPGPNFDARVQQFENGQMIYSRGMVYVIYGDDSWERFQDTNSGGFQSDDQINRSGDDPAPESGDDDGVDQETEDSQQQDDAQVNDDDDDGELVPAD
jgi:hypothetical protein